MTKAEFERQFSAATRRGEAYLRKHPRAVAVRYDKRARLVRVELSNGCLFAFPPSVVQGLQMASGKELTQIRILGPGTALDWPDLDVQCQITSLLAGVFGTRAWMARQNTESSTAPTNSPSAPSRIVRQDPIAEQRHAKRRRLSTHAA